MAPTPSLSTAPLLAQWSETNVRPVGSTQIGNDDTGSWSKTTEDADT